ncbi:MAG: dihydrodipicolinate synthase family protein [Desulfatibacillaceae bacterium]
METPAARTPRGVICPLPAPFGPDGVPDPDLLERLICHAGTGAAGLLVGDPVWARGFDIVPESRRELAEQAMEIVQGRWPLFIVCTMTEAAKTSVFMAGVESYADRMEYPGLLFWVDYPLAYHSNRGLPAFYEFLATETRLPLVVANVPEALPAGRPGRRRNLTPGVFERLAANSMVAGMVCGGTIHRHMQYQSAARRREDFRFYEADESAFLKSPTMGGVVAGGGTLVPTAWKAMARACLSGGRHTIAGMDLEEAGAFFTELHRFLHKEPASRMPALLAESGIVPGHYAKTARLSRSDKETMRTLAMQIQRMNEVNP